MDQNVVNLIVAGLALLVSFYAIFLVNQLRKTTGKPGNDDNSSRQMQLQAYERLVMLATRIGLPNLVSRSNQGGMDARQMQLLLLETVRQEYDYNSTQQIYVSQQAWEAIKNLKEQNMLIINQVGASLPEGATGIDLNRRILEFTMNNNKGTLHELVMEALNYEAKKLMK